MSVLYDFLRWLKRDKQYDGRPLGELNASVAVMGLPIMPLSYRT